MFDALIVGSELDAWVSAASLLERGRSVCVAAPGEGSLHFAPGGIHVLGHMTGGEAGHVESPFESMDRLDHRHPYRLAGAARARAALDWFAASPLGEGYRQDATCESNSLAITPAGLTLPVWRAGNRQATAERIAGKRIVILHLNDHRDFPVGLVSAELSRCGERVVTVEVDPPDGRSASVAIAQALDSPTCRASWLAGLKKILPPDAEVLLVPAVFGHDRHHEAMVMAVEMLGLPVFEVPTLPPCLPGMRLAAACKRHVQQSGTLQFGCRVVGMSSEGNSVCAVTDANGRVIEAQAFILATGGVLMGGLEVDSHGHICEPALGLDVYQTEPLSQIGSQAAVNALHSAGIETDEHFKPRHKGNLAWRNLFVTGRNLAHWNPGAEISAEGVAIVSGWVAAEAANDVLEGGP